MGRIIPNKDRVGSDICLSPLEVKVPMLLADNGTDCFWFPDALDGISAQRMTFAMLHGLATEVHQVDIRLIVPAASDIRASPATCIVFEANRFA